MKQCSKCKEELPISLFSKNNTKPGGFQAWCKSCNAKASKRYYKDRTDQHRKDIQRRKKIGQEYIRSLKNVPCFDCGIRYSYWIMHFDHLENKKFNVSSMYNHSFKMIDEEVSKCDVVCANCHADRTFKRRKSNSMPL